MLIFGQGKAGRTRAPHGAHYKGRRPHPTPHPPPPRPGPPSRRPLPGANPAWARPWWPYQRIRASRLKAQVRTGGRVLEPGRAPDPVVSAGGIVASVAPEISHLTEPEVQNLLAALRPRL